MKKLIAIILIFVLILPATAFADDLDPIVGCYYLFYDKAITPEMATSFGAYDRIIVVYTFLSDGAIVCLEHDVLNGSGVPSFGSCGKWEHEGAGYKYSIIGFGEGSAFLRDECVFIGLNNNSVYFKLQKLIPLNPYADYVFK